MVFPICGLSVLSAILVPSYHMADLSFRAQSKRPILTTQSKFSIWILLRYLFSDIFVYSFTYIFISLEYKNDGSQDLVPGIKEVIK